MDDREDGCGRACMEEPPPHRKYYRKNNQLRGDIGVGKGHMTG